MNFAESKLIMNHERGQGAHHWELGLNHFHNSEFGEAKESLGNALDMYGQIFGEVSCHVDICKAQENLAACSFRENLLKAGNKDYEEAKNYALDALAKYRKLYQAHDHQIEFARMLSLIATCFFLQGEDQSALQYYKDALAEYTCLEIHQVNKVEVQRIQEAIKNLES